jgi:hypothetical protein
MLAYSKFNTPYSKVYYNQLIPCMIEKHSVSQLVNKSSGFYVRRRYITVELILYHVDLLHRGPYTHNRGTCHIRGGVTQQ